MILRLVIALGGITFVITGLRIFLTDACSSVTWGARGAPRAGNFSATCHDAIVDGAMSQGAAGILAVVTGVLLILTISVPLFRSRIAEIAKH